ncbi:MAG: 2-amino-4-hydroxy-6-hydroxymethyldihydropteridine diphosphokinase [Alphaproteobacteria bacterium]|nr:2-amino-4-hydroxy-6-hydroxymethyldihydropteridine diphosphokinase [Alphaproteobacteria bacterium]
MILIAIGANLPTVRHGAPIEAARASIGRFADRGLEVVACSRWFKSAPVPASDQPWFVNAVARVATALAPEAVLASLHAIEAEFGRVRGARDAARVLDLDLLDYHGLRRAEPGGLILPHPRMVARAFVLLPLADIAPGWRHPVSGHDVATLIARVPEGQICLPIDEAESRGPTSA